MYLFPPLPTAKVKQVEICTTASSAFLFAYKKSQLVLLKRKADKQQKSSTK